MQINNPNKGKEVPGTQWCQLKADWVRPRLIIVRKICLTFYLYISDRINIELVMESNDQKQSCADLKGRYNIAQVAMRAKRVMEAWVDKRNKWRSVRPTYY